MPRSTHAVPRWDGPALPIAWLVGFPALTTATVVLVAVLVATAAMLPRSRATPLR